MPNSTDGPDHAPQIFGAGLVPGHARQAARKRPATIAVHDHGNMAWESFEGQFRGLTRHNQSRLPG